MDFISEASIDLVIVTYGDRYHFLEPILDRVTQFNEINKVVLVNNGSNYPLDERVSKYNKIDVVTFEKNTGSAEGFHAGMKRALELEGDFIWLLDDDNQPEINAIDELRKAQILLKNEKAIVSSFRDDRLELLNRGGQSFNRNSFFEFDFFQKILKKQVNYGKKGNLLKCEAVPYGGLLINKNVIKSIGLPLIDYYLYCDDIDFTYRMTNQGYEIYCVTDSVIVDLESSWYRKENVPMFKGIFLTDEISRGLYSIRNRVYFEKKYIADSKYHYYFNIFVYMSFVLLKYMPKNIKGIKRYFRVLNAINRGKNGQLGKDSKW